MATHLKHTTYELLMMQFTYLYPCWSSGGITLAIGVTRIFSQGWGCTQRLTFFKHSLNLRQ